MNYKRMTLANKKIKDLIKKDEEFQKQFSDLMKMVKEAKVNMDKVQEDICRLDRCKEEDERCKADSYKKLKEGVNGFEEEIAVFEKQTKNCTQKITTAFDSGVNIAGILTFSDIDSMGDMGKQVEKLFGELQANWNENIKSSAKDEQSADEALLLALDTCVESELEACMSIAVEKAISNVYSFVCDPECDKKKPEKIKEICDKFSEGIPPSEGNEDCAKLEADGHADCDKDWQVTK